VFSFLIVGGAEFSPAAMAASHDYQAAADGASCFDWLDRKANIFHSLSRQIDVNDEVVTVWGRESGGDYLECVDRATGKSVGHRIFRSGLAQSVESCSNVHSTP
jgi:hypothetical protein